MRPISVLLAVGVAAFAAGCAKSDLMPNVSPSSGKTDVPVNAVMHVYYLGMAPIKEADINPKNFELTKCATESEGAAADGSAKESPADGDATTTDGSSKKQTTKAPAANTPVEGILWYQFGKQPVDTKKGPQVKHRTDIYFIPMSKSYAQPPLEEDTQYCFNISAVRDTQKREMIPDSIIFHTEESASMSFDKGDKVPLRAKWVIEPEHEPLGPSDPVVVQFGEEVHVNPWEFQNGSTLCNSEKGNRASTSTSDVCGGWGRADSPSFYLLERLVADEGSNIIKTQFNTFAMESNLNPEFEYDLKLGLSSGSQKRSRNIFTDPRIHFTVEDKTEIKSVQDILGDPLIKKIPLFTESEQ